ncbi:MAG TPA: hypothetical protein GX396_09245 [Tissierellia bacterium]|nr:hypothetical protein [Tissierellia bacterium]
MKYNLNVNKKQLKTNTLNMNNNLNSNEETGYLEITVTDAQTGMPVRNVLIEIFELIILGQFAERGYSRLIERYATDENGRIPITELPVSEWPEHRYFAILEGFGYHSVNLVNIPIYEGVTTVYHVELNRITSPEPVREYIRTPTRIENYYPTPPVWFF